MRQHPRQRNTLVAGVAATAATILLAAGASGTTSATAGAAPVRAAGATARSASGEAARPAAARAAARPTAARPLLLINGDRALIRMTAQGGRAIALLPAPGSGPVSSLQLGQRAEIIPADAQPYLGRGLDPSLFDVSSLQREQTGGGCPCG